MASTYDSILKIIKSITIKYNYIAENNETLESQLSADEYLDALEGKTTFDSYIDYSYDEMVSVGITDNDIIVSVLNGDISVVPDMYKEPLYNLRVKRILDNYVEQNNYYRMLNGLPDLSDNTFYYITDSMAENFGIDKNIPVHMIQDYYNKIHAGDGDYYISLVEGAGYIDSLYAANPTKEYLRFVGTNNRISISKAEKLKISRYFL